jgi:hypothetical protein
MSDSPLAKAFAGLKPQVPEHPGTQEPEYPGTQAPKKAPIRRPKLVPLPLQGTAKSRHPEYTPVKVFLRRETHKSASRKWQDQQDYDGAAAGDFSDLVEQLLQKYLDANT